MSKSLTLRGKFILIAVLLGIFATCLYVLKLQIGAAILFFFLFPILIVLLGKTAELIIGALEKVSTGPLSLTALKHALLLICYYISFSIFLALLIENSIILSILNFRPDEWQVAIIGLSLAFLPRVLSYASGMERARKVLLAILTPLTFTSAVMLLSQPETIAFRLQTLELCIVGSLVQTILGDLTLYSAGFLGIIHPTVTFETISLLDLRELVCSQLETIQWNTICQILKKAKQFDRVDIIQKILKSMEVFIDESRKRGAKLVRIVFVDALVKTIYSEPNLQKELVPFLENLKKDKEAEVRARVAYGFGVMSKMIPDKSLQSLSELLNDKDLIVLEEVGGALTILLRSNSKAVSHTMSLSLNPVFLEWLMKQTRLLQMPMRHPQRRELLRFGEHPILKALKAAYINSPDTVFAHIQSCSLDKETKLRVLAAAIVSDQDFVQNNTRLVQVRERLKKDKNDYVRNATEFYRFHVMLRSLYKLPTED